MKKATLDIHYEDARIFIEAFSCLKLCLQKWAECTANGPTRHEIALDLAFAADLHHRIEQTLVEAFGAELLAALYRDDDDL